MNPALKYFCRYCLTWLIEFWLRPQDILAEIKRNDLGNTAFWTAFINGLLLGILLCATSWLQTRNILVEVSVATACIFACLFRIILAAVDENTDDDFIYTLISTVSIIFFVDKIPIFGESNTYNDFIMVMFIGTIISLFIFIVSVAGKESDEGDEFVDIIACWLIVVVVCLGCATTITNISVIAIAIVFSLSMGIFIRKLPIFYDENSITNKQTEWLQSFWLLFSILSGTFWIISVISYSDLVSEKLEKFALFFMITPMIVTGLPFWIFIALVSLWQYRNKNIISYSQEIFLQKIPFLWQTFAYPLPGLANYLFKIGQQNIQDGLTAIETTQYKTLQNKAVKTAIFQLASHQNTAFNFCAEYTLKYNTNTANKLALTGSFGCAIAGLIKHKKDHDKQNVRFYLGELKDGIIINYLVDFQSEKSINNEITKFIFIRERKLSERLKYSEEKLSLCRNYVGYTDFAYLLKNYQHYLIQDFISIPRLSFSQFNIDYQQTWLKYGWSVLNEIIKLLVILKDYPELTSQSARQEFLIKTIEILKDIDLNIYPDYWKNIGIELALHWIDLLEKEILQARKFQWLKLDIKLEKSAYLLNTQNLLLCVINVSNTTARNLLIQVEDNQTIHWNHQSTRLNILETQQQKTVQLEFECHETGEYRISGKLTAEDISSNPYSVPFTFQINVGKKGKPYQVQDIQPYYTGEGLGSDRVFVARTELIHWLHSYWKQPEAKPAIALMGQRRIGKTSLLNKIQRSGLSEVNLIPVLIDLQDGIQNDYVFLNKTAQKMAIALNQAAITLSTENSYAAFTDFLHNLKPQLQQNRFLMMLDEAELIFDSRFSNQLADFLRALMQGHQHPLLLLFCGTYLLQRKAQEYYSIFFNTVQFKKVSYMNAQEAAEVLEKPAGEILQYDPDSLKTAYQLTRGQPLLLQTLGANLIENFNQAVWNGEERSHYVSLNDLDHAAKTLVEHGSPAFEQHWQDNQGAAHYVLSALAWAIDEINRPSLDMNGLLNIMQQERLIIPENSEKQVFAVLERLIEEEILVRENLNLSYRFAVPLYRRWIAWRWSPELVQNESI